jgi:glucokinase
LAALKWLPYGGLYLAGGLTPRNLEAIKDPNGAFIRSFYNKGRVSSSLKDIPVYAVLVDDLGERGAHYIATRETMLIN